MNQPIRTRTLLSAAFALLSLMGSAIADTQPRDTMAPFDYALSCIQNGRVDDAVATYRTILAHNPTNLSALYNTGYALKMGGFVDQAIDYYQKVIALSPTHDMAQFALGHAYLHKGDFASGWAQHERYLKKANKYAPELRALLNNNTLKGKTVLLIPEGGLGDTVQFIRYAQLLKERGATVIAMVQKPLIPLLSSYGYLDQVIPFGPNRPAHDAWVTVMSLPAVFCSDEQTIPKDIPYLHARPEHKELWHERLNLDTQIKIGICWQADVANDVSRPPVARRGIPLEKLYPLAHLPNVSLYSLQRFDGVEQLQSVPADVDITIFDETFDVTNGSFVDTAAVMENLDLIISVDTATAHLAGALGRPVWLLLPYATDWRWIAHRSDSPWYPTMRIFKQPAPFDWDTVVTELLLELISFTRNKTDNR